MSEAIRGILAELVQLEGHHLLEANRFNLAELYPAGLAITFGGRLVTFDRTIPWRALTGCEADDLEVLAG
jgi:hypothetical protein